MNKNELQAIEEGIKKSGFVLEHKVTELLLKHNWVVINNKYYFDDEQETVREIDIVAYKVRTANEILFYTVLIISCKKNAENNWAILVRDKDDKDPNIDWFPQRVWSNNKMLKHMLDGSEWKKQYFELSKRQKVFERLFEVKRHNFAFQEISKKNGSIQNDKNIFNSISTLVKAESYEVGSLDKRKKDTAFYHFNLLSVIDTNLAQIYFNTDEITAEQIQEGKFVFNYIVNKQQICSRIHFIQIEKLDSLLNSYDALNEVNSNFFSDLYNSFFDKATEIKARRDILQPNFQKAILPYLNSTWLKEHDKSSYFKEVWLWYSQSEDRLSICLSKSGGNSFDEDFSDEKFLNENQAIQEKTTGALKDIFRYSGKFIFSIDIPF